MQAIISEGYVAGSIGRLTQLHASYYSAAHGFGVEFEAKLASEIAQFCTSLRAGRDGLWLARVDEIEGSIALDGSRATEHGAHLRWFITSAALRGSGVGRLLLDRALQFADDCGYDSVYLWTFAGLDAARHLYESRGFRLAHEAPGSRWGKTVTEQRFVRVRHS